MTWLGQLLRALFELSVVFSLLYAVSVVAPVLVVISHGG